ncbi:DNA-processing protein DprA [Heyndrickxia sp. NPDC080065]|uniref:DNA-processing protein DprA n=1 Tax=Heyndrickxia sp. NPDC080065 TaxID=3390568 RepID=UPI003D038026
MEELKKRLIHLHHCRGIGSKGILKIMKIDSELKNLYQFSISVLQDITRISSENFSKFYYDLHHLDLTKILTIYSTHNISCMTIFDKEYPFILKQIYNPPLVLYTIGNTSLLNYPSIAIVGSRKGNEYAKKSLEQLLPLLVKKRLNVISGLARGVDTIAHQMTIRYGGKTIGVLGSGFFHIYPQENRMLVENMKKGHLLISEYPPSTRPQKWHFPMRNRIISGLSKGILIVQAEERSGSLITAEYALQEGREVFAVPGNMMESLSKGTNLLIQQGAKLVLTGEDILAEMNI